MHSDKNTLIVGWNSITEKFLLNRLNNSTQYSIIDLESNYKKNVNFKYFSEKEIDKKSNQDIKHIFYFFENYNQTKLLKISNLCRKKNINLFIGSNKKAVKEKHFVDLRNISNIFLNTKIYRSTSLRIFDIIFSFIAIIILLPVFIIVSILIAIDDGFPILFSQKRVGLNDKFFLIYKFRSMYKNVNKYGTSPSKINDNRITKIGTFIRKTSIDEIPQFLNVLKGDMSIVGPRPEMPFIVKEYNAFEKLRLKIKPGITGAWQVSSTRNAPIHYNIDYDLYQIMNNSLRYNIKQILKTLIWASKGL